MANIYLAIYRGKELEVYGCKTKDEAQKDAALAFNTRIRSDITVYLVAMDDKEIIHKSPEGNT